MRARVRRLLALSGCLFAVGGAGIAPQGLAAARAAQEPPVDLELFMTGDPAGVPLGGEITYQLTVANRGPGTAGAVLVTDHLPGGSSLEQSDPSQGSVTTDGQQVRWDAGTLEPGATATLSLIVEAPRRVGSIHNRADATSSGTETDPPDNSAEVATRVGTPKRPDLVGSWTRIERTVTRSGEDLRAVLHVTNAGTARSAASRARVLLSQDGVPSRDDALLVTLAVPAIAAGDSRSLTVHLTLDPAVSAAGKRLLAILDPDRRLSELKEKNNRAVSAPIP